MSITLYTGRAKKQNMGLVSKLNEVDKALTVFDRDNVYVKNWIKNFKISFNWKFELIFLNFKA